ncbi:MAG TPA: GNAT family N-acetyltransferase [Amycolatopsis sp.]|nr:GNAT family N-acetyltransferase [Amycolatopsis sp.]
MLTPKNLATGPPAARIITDHGRTPTPRGRTPRGHGDHRTRPAVQGVLGLPRRVPRAGPRGPRRARPSDPGRERGGGRGRDRLLGYYRLDGTPPDGELVDLFVDPTAIGTGLGRRLWEHAVAQARERGFRSLELEADPHAEPFYSHMGARRIGSRTVASGRTLPVLRVDVARG